MIGGTRRTARSTVTIECGPSRDIATSAVMIFVVEAIWRRTCARFAQSTFPVVPSTRIAERALILIPCPETGPVWWMSGLAAADGRGRNERNRSEDREKNASHRGPAKGSALSLRR